MSAALLCAGLGVLILSLRSEEVAPPASGPAGAERGVLEREPENRGPERAEPEVSDSRTRIQVLELESGDRSGERGSSWRLAEESEPEEPWTAAPLPLPEGRSRIRFAVEDGSGRPVSGASVSLRSLDPGGGVDQTVTGRHGEARFVGLAAGRYAYRVEAPRRPKVASAATVQLKEAERLDLTVHLVGADLTIAGRLLNQQGEPVPGIEISAVRHRFASTVSEAAPGDRSAAKTRSGADGWFGIAGLAEGEYEVETTATDRYSSMKTLLQAGGAPVDLILVEGLRVHGTVMNPTGEPLARVWVGLQAHRDSFVYTDDWGSYELVLGAGLESGDSTLRFYLQGYEEGLAGIPAPQAEAPLEVRLDMVLRAVENAAGVSGLVRSERGDPIAGATVTLTSRTGTRYQSVSSPDGSFSIPAVKIDAGYYLRVLPPAPFTDYSKRDIRVPEEGVWHEVVLDSLQTGRLTGRMVDAEQNPIPGFRLWLVSVAATRSAVPITGDERGYFELAEAPAGVLSFDTRSSPRLLVTGIFLPVEGEAEVLLVLDSGDHAMAGEVLDDRGDPVRGADVTLSWSWSGEGGETRSTSTRTTRTDADGLFRFQQLGPGKHTLQVRAEGHAPHQEHYEVGPYAAEVEVRLESSSR